MASLLGDGWDSPQSGANMALAAGLLRGDFGGGLLGAQQAYQGSQDHALKLKLAQLQMQQGQMGLDKGGLELEQMRQQIARSGKIRDDLARLQGGGMPGQPAPQPAAPQFDTPQVGGIPFFSQGTTPKLQPQMSPQAQMNQPPPGAGFGESQAKRLVDQANVYTANGDFEGANKLLEHAAKFMPEVKEMGVLMRDGKPVNVITFKDGTQKVTDLAPTPKVHWADTGGSVQPINEYTMSNMGPGVTKTMTPGETASNALGWANNATTQRGQNMSNSATLRGQNLTDDRARQTIASGRIPSGYRQSADGGLEFVPGGPADPNAAKKAAPTEFQGKSAGYGARAQASDKTLREIEGSYSPAAVNTKNALSRTPLLGGAMEAGANAMLSDPSQKADQAQRDFVNAVLRQESGAAISAGEFDNARKQYFPQTGDSKAVIEQKANNRQLVIRGFEQNSRPGAMAEIGSGGATGEWSPVKKSSMSSGGWSATLKK